MGGVWERQIRTVRNVLNGLLKRSGQRLTTSSLRTFMYEVMAIVNSRPLSAESLESPDGPLPLTPNHILTMKSFPIPPPPGNFEPSDVYVKKRWRCIQRLADEFWLLWKRSYLSSLQLRQVWQKPQRNLSVGDVVILRDDNVCRSEWKLARVLDIYPSDDGLVRSVKLLISSSSLDDHGKPRSPGVILVRPVHKITVLIAKNEDE